MAIFFQERESKVLEFKSTVQRFEGVIKTAIAFANGVGGKIIIGVDDQTREILGINDDLRDKIYDHFPNSLYDSTSPNLIPQIYEQRIGEKEVLIIEIPPALKKPCFLRSKGIPKGVYIRIGSSTRSANQEYISELMRENRRFSFDEQVIQENLKVLSNSLLKDFYKKKTNAALLEDKIIKRSCGNSEVFYPTVAGILLFSETPNKYLPEAHVICTRFSGNSGREIIQTEEISGSIAKQIEVSFNLVSSWIKRNYVLEGARMKPHSLIPPEALREAIINAVIHRKYTIHGATKIALYDDHLEIFSPGNFPGHVNINNLGEGITHLRNPIVGRMAHKMGIIEKLGSGIKLIFDSCRASKIVPPVFSEDGDYVKIKFEFKILKNMDKPDEEILMDLFKVKLTLNIHEIIDHLGLSKNTIFKVLHRLIDQGLVKRIGQGKNTRYSLIK